MKKFVTTLMVGSAMALAACAPTKTEADFGYETQAPYADERTVGRVQQPAPAPRAERVFETRQRK